MISKIARKFFSNNVQIRQTNLLINGKFVPSVSGQTFDTFNPATEEKITSVAHGDARDVDLAVSAARKAFESGPWSQMGGEERRRLMLRLADLMEKNQDELALLESLDNGKPINDSRAIDIPHSVEVIRHFAGYADKIHGTVYPAQDHLIYTREEPVGVVGGIYAWNFPIALLTWKLGPGLAAGCTFVMQPAEQTPLSALRIGELIMEAGFPEGVVNFVTGFGDTGAALVRHPNVDKISFTGSTEVGREILANSGTPNVKRITCELGGKSANIILNDANLENAVAQAEFGLFFNQGQCCCAGSRVFVQSGIYDRFIEACANRASKRVLGDQFSTRTSQGPQVDGIQQEKIFNYIKKGKEQGAQLMTGGQTSKSGKGFFVQPTVFADVKDDMIIAKEEIFGPVMSILKFDSLDEVSQRANNSIYGLAAGVVTNNVQNALYLANRIRAGTIYVNCYDIFRPNTPFGGFKDSGVGREHGMHGLKSYLETQTIVIKQ